MANPQNSRGPLRSSEMTKGVDRATHRSLLYSMGWRSEHLNKPLVAVVNSFNEARCSTATAGWWGRPAGAALWNRRQLHT
jgi:dihydroxyacid dehydratase/phosphogluconate dehydratase